MDNGKCYVLLLLLLGFRCTPLVCSAASMLDSSGTIEHRKVRLLIGLKLSSTWQRDLQLIVLTLVNVLKQNPNLMETQRPRRRCITAMYCTTGIDMVNVL